MSNIWDEYDWDIWDPIKNPLPIKVNKYRKISFCTTCMNRLNDLSKTLIPNILDNIDYPNVEFVLLNYNSSDELEQWVQKNLMSYIESGVLVYFKTTEPEYYSMPHSRNVAFKAATGEIVNSVDADNYTHKGFAAIINRMAECRKRWAVFAKGKKAIHGRIGYYKNEFLDIGGYDEGLTGYGFDDHNLLYRAMCMGFRLMWWGNKYFARIKTDKINVMVNMKEKDWRKTERRNREISMDRLKKRELIANIDHHWGKAHLIRNFSEELEI